MSLSVLPQLIRSGRKKRGEAQCSGFITPSSVVPSNCHTFCVNVYQSKGPPLQLPHFLLMCLDIVGCSSEILQTDNLNNPTLFSPVCKFKVLVTADLALGKSSLWTAVRSLRLL